MGPTGETRGPVDGPAGGAKHGAASRRRRQAVLLGGAALLVLGGLALWLIGRSDAGTLGVLVALGIVAVLLQGVTLVVALLLLRRAGLARGLDADFQKAIRRRSRRMLKQGVDARRGVIDLTTEVHVLTTDAAAARKFRDDEVRRESTRDRRALEMHLDTQRQVQALLNLDKLVRIDAAVPPMGGWAASADLLVLCVQSLIEESPRTLVECGSGVSTLMLALAAEQHDLPTRVVALEHDAQYAQETRQLLARHGMADRAEVRLAPLQPVALSGHDTPWYDAAALDDLKDIGILLVDGPPGATGPQARYPALPLLRDRLSPRCLVVMDDLNRAADLEVAKRWNDEMDDFELRVVGELQKQVGLLTRG